MSGVCSAQNALGVAYCYINSEGNSASPAYQAASEYKETADLHAEFRISWTVYRGISGRLPHISVMLQARTLGWVAFGLMKDANNHGMTETDMWWGRVVNGVAEVHDSFSPYPAPPVKDIDRGGAHDIYNVTGAEVDGITILRFKRALVTGDVEDHPIVQGPIPVVYALNRQSSDDAALYHGPSRGFTMLNLMPFLPTCARYDFVSSVGSCESGSRLVVLSYAELDPDIRNCTGGFPSSFSDSTECDYVPAVSPAARALMAVASLTILLKLLVLFGLVRKRHEREVRRTQPLLSAMLVVGTILLDATAFMLLGPASTPSCSIRPVWISMTVTLSLGPITMKAYRIFRIFGMAKKGGAVLSEGHLVCRLMGLLVVNAAILMLTLITSPIHPASHMVLEQEVVYFDRTVCDIEATRFVALIEGVFVGLLCLFTLTMAWATRGVFSEFNESKPTVQAVATVALVAVLALGTNFASDSSPTVVYMATVLPMCVGSTYVVLTFFMPKLTHFCKPAASFDQTKLERTMGLTKQMSGSEVSALSLDAKEELIMIQQASLRKMQEIIVARDVRINELLGNDGDEGEGEGDRASHNERTSTIVLDA